MQGDLLCWICSVDFQYGVHHAGIMHNARQHAGGYNKTLSAGVVMCECCEYVQYEYEYSCISKSRKLWGTSLKSFKTGLCVALLGVFWGSVGGVKR